MDKASYGAVTRYILQGVAFSGVILGGLVYASACIQIDSYKKIADYKQQYEDYKNQTEELFKMGDVETIKHFPDLMGPIMDERLNLVKTTGDDFYENVYGEKYSEAHNTVDPGSSVIEVGTMVGNNISPNSTSVKNTPAAKCWQAQYADGMSFDKNSPIVNTENVLCDSQGRDTLAGLSVKPGSDGSIVQPNPEMEAEISRGLLENEYPVLSIVRSDLAWLRDNPDLWQPLRMSAEGGEVTLLETGHLVKDQMRLGAFLIGRGLPMVDYDNIKHPKLSIMENERQQRSAQAVATVSSVADAFGSYPAGMASLMPITAGLKSVTKEDVEQAQDGDRKAMLLKFTQLESQVDLLREESKQRYLRLLGLWTANISRAGYSSVLNMPE